MEKPTQRVVCAAIRNSEGKIICGARHYDGIMHSQIIADGGNWITADQGFIDQFGTYLTRQEAYLIAKENGQIIRDHENADHGQELYSENLY